MINADLHIHTYYSDGQQSPKDVIDAAKKAGVTMLSVTDHDTMNGSEKVRELCKENDITAVDGIEISAYDGVKVHVLGYNLDKNNPVFANFLKYLYESSEARTYDILKKLKRCGVNITMDDVVKERKYARSPIHSTYIARAVARKGYGGTPSEVFMTYLNLGKSCYSALGRPTPEQAVQIIKECGGVASLAHPGRITLDPDKKLELIDKLISCGLDGIEAVYSGHTENDTAYYKEIARVKKLAITGGSDTHFSSGIRSIGNPIFHPDDRLLWLLKLL
jgi:hypothetical protein